MLETTLRQRAKSLINKTIRIIRQRAKRNEMLTLTPDENRAAQYCLQVYQATIDEYSAQNPTPLVNMGEASTDDLQKLFARVKKPTLS